MHESVDHRCVIMYVSSPDDQTSIIEKKTHKYNHETFRISHCTEGKKIRDPSDRVTHIFLNIDKNDSDVIKNKRKSQDFFI